MVFPLKREMNSVPEIPDVAIAFCRGFLTTRDSNREAARLFCRAFLQTIQQQGAG